MNTTTGRRREIVVGIDPVREGHLALAWAADEAHHRRLALRLVVAVPPAHDTQHVDDTPRHQARTRRGKDALRAAADWARTRRPDVAVTSALADGPPAAVMAGLAQEAAMTVLGSRHLSRAEEFLSTGSLVVPVTARARCPVVVVGDAEHTTQDPAYLVVGVDGSESSRAALALAFEEADLRRCALRAIAVWQPPRLHPPHRGHPVPRRAPAPFGDHGRVGREVPGRPPHPRSAHRLARRTARGRRRARRRRRRRASRPGRLHRHARRLGRPRSPAPRPLPRDHRPHGVSTSHVDTERPPGRRGHPADRAHRDGGGPTARRRRARRGGRPAARTAVRALPPNGPRHRSAPRRGTRSGGGLCARRIPRRTSCPHGLQGDGLDRNGRADRATVKAGAADVVPSGCDRRL